MPEEGRNPLSILTAVASGQVRSSAPAGDQNIPETPAGRGEQWVVNKTRK